MGSRTAVCGPNIFLRAGGLRSSKGAGLLASNNSYTGAK
jgi:hypothetical protein